ncbi:MAG TPA: 50S ribosomal protein L25, partial [Patescibacteria group bacterium]|nr:50S ribosomal protein L25 [Patescibacteria group bacterium]
MKKVSLQVNERKVLGKKVKKLRKEGLLPANVYGKEVKSLAVELPTKEFEKTFKEVGETGLVELKVDGQMKPVLIHNVQYDPVSHEPLHADFYQVNLKEKVKTSVPVSFVGEPQAIINKVGILLEQISELEVEALPTDLPENIEVNVEKLANVDDQITVAEIKAPAGVTILSDASQVV